MEKLQNLDSLERELSSRVRASTLRKKREVIAHLSSWLRSGSIPNFTSRQGWTRILNTILPEKPSRLHYLDWCLSFISMKNCPKCRTSKEVAAFSSTNASYKYCLQCKQSMAREVPEGKEAKNRRLVRQRLHYQENKKYYVEKDARRRAAKLQATPKWSQTEEIRELYLNCPEGYHVDHIIPLNNALVCGLHVLENLQYLIAEDNLKKSNKFEQ